MEHTEWTQLTLHGKSRDLELLSAIMSMLDEGLMIEDYSDLSGDSPFGEVIPPELAARDREAAAVSVFLPTERVTPDLFSFVRERILFSGIEGRLETVGIREEDWAENWKQYYHPIPFGRLTVVPAWEDYTPAEGELILRMDPGTAFGTATHETTYMMIELLNEEIKGGERVLDVGCGSGILALAARLLGADSALCCDLDPEAVRVAKKNIADAGLSRVAAVESDLLSAIDPASGPYDVIVANIVSDILLRLAPSVAPYLAPNGLFAVSGILNGREDEVRAGITACGFTLVREKHEGDWHAMLFGRGC